MYRSIVSVLFILAVFGAAGAQAADLSRFVGRWNCKGTFSNGAPIAAAMRIESDAPSGALIVHHDDVPPGAYHSLEVWTMDKSGAGLRAAISDKYSGMRWFESRGWEGGTLTLVRSEDGKPKEQFAYEFKGGSLQVQWSVMQGGAMRVGDTISCNRA
jgi:hypothetical protein